MAFTIHAVAAGDRERHHHAVADLQLLHIAADLDNLAHEFMAQDVTLFHRRDEAVIQVQVGPADRRGGDPDDRVVRVQDLGIGHLLYPDIVLAHPASGSHDVAPPYDPDCDPDCNSACNS